MQLGPFVNKETNSFKETIAIAMKWFSTAHVALPIFLVKEMIISFLKKMLDDDVGTGKRYVA